MSIPVVANQSFTVLMRGIIKITWRLERR